jgi:phage terminase large subunit
VYGEGELGTVEGLVFDAFNQIDIVPEGAKLLGYGVDFGYTNDPSSIIALYSYNNELIYDELVYSTGLTNANLMQAFIAAYGDRTLQAFADSSEPKSIDELYLTGWSGIRPVVKGSDSIRNGIQVMKSKRMNVTKRSVNLIKELRNYRWATDKTGKTISPERPVDNFNHAIDAARYAAMMLIGMQHKQVIEIDIF